MNNLFRFGFLFLISVTLFFLSLEPAVADIQISGVVTAKKDDSVQVEFTPNKTAVPQKGDTVEFFKMKSGIELKGGTGQVTEVEKTSVWIKITKKRADLKMQARIIATGKIDMDAILLKAFESVRFNKPDKADSLKLLKEHSDSGNTDALGYLGAVYIKGFGGVTKDTDKGFAMLKKAAASGSVISKTGLGTFYLHGDSIDKDYSKALELLTSSANEGHAEGMYFLGYMYNTGKGIPLDNTKALEWFRKAADLNNKTAIYAVGFYYELGLSVKKDMPTAVKFYKKAQELGSTHATNRLKELKALGVNIE